MKCLKCFLLLNGPFVMCFSPMVGSLAARVLVRLIWAGLLNMCFPLILAQGIITSNPVY